MELKDPFKRSDRKTGTLVIIFLAILAFGLVTVSLFGLTQLKDTYDYNQEIEEICEDNRILNTVLKKGKCLLPGGADIVSLEEYIEYHSLNGR